MALEKVVFDIYVLGPWVHCWGVGQSECGTVVFKHLALHCWLGVSDRYSLVLELLYKVHDRYDLSQGLAKADVLGFAGGQGNFGHLER
jgi:hypothetical protein